MEKGLVHIYYGYGKGKSTAAAGLAIRAAAKGLKVLYSTFLKDNTSGEIIALKEINNITVYDKESTNGFIFKYDDEKKKEILSTQKEKFLKLCKIISADDYDVVILDEVIDAVELSCFHYNELANFIKNKPQKLEIVITGHNFIEGLNELADYITEFKCEKHPFNNGVSARNGIEY